MGKVKPHVLLAIAGAFWLVAGVNVAIVGLNAYGADSWSPFALVAMVAGTVAIFLVFFLFIFKPYAAKHAARIDAILEEAVSVLRVMDRKGYVMIAFMIALGVTLRLSGVVPDWFIAFFYVGLGAALALTGVLFLNNWRRRG